MDGAIEAATRRLSFDQLKAKAEAMRQSREERESVVGMDGVPIIEEHHAKPESPVIQIAKPEPPTRKDSVIRPFLVGLCSVISASSVLVSFTLTLQWFDRRGSGFLAIPLSGIIVATILVSPQISRMLAIKGHKGMARIMRIIAVVAACFSMTTTLGALYDGKSDEVQSAFADKGEGELLKAEREALVELRSSARKEYDNAVADEERYRNLLDDFTEQGIIADQRVNTATTRRNAATKLAKESRAEIERLDEKIRGLNATLIQSGAMEAESRPDFATWIADIFGLDRDKAELAIDAIPAMFVDIIAPLMLMAAMAI